MNPEIEELRKIYIKTEIPDDLIENGWHDLACKLGDQEAKKNSFQKCFFAKAWYYLDHLSAWYKLLGQKLDKNIR